MLYPKRQEGLKDLEASQKIKLNAPPPKFWYVPETVKMNADSASALRLVLLQVSQMLNGIAAALPPPAPPPLPAPVAAPLPAPVAAPLPVPARQPRRCSDCRRPGHTRGRCPERAARLLEFEARAAAAAAAAAPPAPPAQPRIRFTRSVQAECPVCLEDKLCCRLACDHLLCGECVVGQHVNGLLNCGLCRAPLAPK